MSTSPAEPDLLDSLRQLRRREFGSERDGTAARLPIAVEVGIRWGKPIDEIRTEMIAEASDQTLVAAFQRLSMQRDDPEANALLAEFERRGLDV